MASLRRCRVLPPPAPRRSSARPLPLQVSRPLRRSPSYLLHAISLASLVVAGACAGDGHPAIPPLSGNPADFQWSLPPGWAAPAVPADNAMSPAKVELGRRLFYDTRLSGNGGFSCASCHRQDFAFADARNIAVGSTGEPHPRNSIGIANTAWLARFNWRDPLTPTLEEQATVPMFSDRPVELGLRGWTRAPGPAPRGRALSRTVRLILPGATRPVHGA